MTKTQKRLAAMAGAIGLFGAGVLGCAGLGRGLFHFPAKREAVAITCAEGTPSLARGQGVKMLAWNIQFAAGRSKQFFYEGGEAVLVDDADRDVAMDGIVKTIQRFDPDIVVLQEVDRNARRTGKVDQHQQILDALGYPCHTTTPYYRVAYVPFPGHQHMGRVGMYLSVYSRFKIDEGVRWQLPLLDEPLYRQMFNLRRALLELHLPLVDGGRFVLFDTHLSAFSRGDGTLGRQVAVLEDHLTVATTAGDPWVLAGDLNALPPGDDPARLGKDAALYAESVTPIEGWFAQFDHPVPADEYANHPERWRTYVPFGGTAPDRTLDYIFSKGVDTRAYSVVTDAIEHSDHLPLYYEFEVR